jgi:hypothetical protein
MKTYLSKQKIQGVAKKVEGAAFDSMCTSALIGGALFKWRGVPGYETEDVDFASDGQLDYGLLPLHPESAKHASWNDNGHYLVNGVKVDFINKLSDGTKELFNDAVRKSRVFKGVRCATLEHAVAIRLAAARPKDIRVVRDMIDKKLVSRAMVIDLIRRFAPESRGARYVAYEWKTRKLGRI